MDLFNQDKEN